MIRQKLANALYFARMLFVVLIVIFQLLFVLTLSLYASKYLNYYYVIEYFLVFATILFINYQPIRITYKISWIIFIGLFPPEGLILYLCYFFVLRYKGFGKKHEVIQKSCEHLEHQNTEILDSVSDLGIKQQLNLIYSKSRYPVCKNTEATYLKLGDDYHAELLKELKKAEKYIFMQYFIISKGQMLDELMEVLVQKANDGVEVYFSYDVAGSIATKPSNFDDYCKANNIKVLSFNKNFASFYQFISFRDHRKISVIDGVVAFTGGINIGDEYINKLLRFGHWKDMGVKLYGDGAKNLSMIFMKGWNFTHPNTFDFDKYLSLATPHNVKSDNLIVSYDDGPYSDDDVAEKTYVRMIVNAKKYVYITTPYLIPSYDIISALKTAVNSGVDVRIITPGIPDKKVIFECTRAHYPNLINAGVKIYEYTPGFIHGKTIVVDDEVAFVGTVNFDYRSLIWNYECGSWVYSNSFAKDVRKDLVNTMEKSNEINVDVINSAPVYLKTFRSAINILAPLL